MRAFLLSLVLLVGGCSAAAEQGAPEEPSPFAVCDAVASGQSLLPAMELPCFTGGRQVRMSTVQGPAVLAFWASWCNSCHAELPVFQRYADSGHRVLGVVSSDRRDAAASFATDLGVRFPNVFDAQGDLLRKEFNKITLPVTVFVDSAGKATVYSGEALTDESLAKLAAEHG